jgi:hypothetical protein
VASLAPAYVPRKPTETVLHQLVRANLESFIAYARANYEGGLPRYVEQPSALLAAGSSHLQPAVLIEHADLSTTSRYLHATSGDKGRAIGLLEGNYGETT